MIKIDEYPFLLKVSKPTRYCGGEINEVLKNGENGIFNVAICFPEVYDIGMSNLGLQILYSALNSKEKIWAQRCFMPFPDMEEELLKRNLALYSLESGMPLNRFDLIGFSLQYELTYSNVLRMLYLGKIPLFSKERDENFPIVIAGGPSAVNPEPLADFIDAFFIGDGEEGFVEICEVLQKEKFSNKEKKLEALCSIEGIYVPHFYRTKEIEGRIVVDSPINSNARKIVNKRILTNLESFPMPKNPIIPSHEIIHDRYALEISRGCSFGCRFCEAGYIYRPLRHRSKKSILKNIDDASRNLGFDEVSLLSLNSGEYPQIALLLERVKEFADSERIEISLPSLRVSSINKELLKSFEKKKKMSFTLAPEAGSERLRRVINKRITDEEILKSAEILFSAGFSSIKLYFIIGLPKETMEDIESIVNLANQIVKIGRNMGVKRLNITVSTSSFVPKPFTPFQWEKVPSKEEIVLKQNYLKKRLKPPINYKWHDIEASLLEAVFSRGDRRLNKVLYEAHLLGCKLDGWAEHFKFDRWLESFNKSGLDFFKMLEEEFKEDDILPWDFIDVGVSKKFFKEEREKAFKEETTDACGEGVCFNCGNLKKICSQIEYTEDDYSLSISERCKNSSIYQYRMLFSKEFPATFIGHLDFVKNIARSFRRSGIEIAYSNGFHPFPQIEVASPLPLGVYGENELMDFVSYSNINGQMVNSLNRNLAQGIRIKEIKKRTKEDLPLNQYTIHNYEVDIGKLSNEKKNIISEMIRKFMEAKDFLIEVKKGSETKSVDLRKKVLNCCMKDEILSIKMVNGGIIKFLETLLKNDEDFLKIKIIRKSVEALPR